MMAQQEKLDSISNNLANINTEGYKRVDVSFKDLVSESLERQGFPLSGNAANANIYTGTGVRASNWLRDERQGSLIETGTSTDFAIDGEGYFSVTMPDGKTAYTRNGSFNVDSEGKLVDKSGNRLNIKFNSENVKLEQGSFKIDEAGNVLTGTGSDIKTVGKVSLYSFVGQDSLLSVGSNLYVPKEGVQANSVNNSAIRQGYLEGSNVDMASEMTDMILTQRAFELGSRGIKTADEMWGMVNNLRGR